MSSPILATKLYIPQPRSNLVLRSRLLERLDQAIQPGQRLTLISAPAGFGKTTLMSEWVAAYGRPVAWISLDKRDSDLTRFLGYLIAALQTVVPGIGADIRDVLQSSPAPPVESILTSLLNDLAVAPDQFVLVLDDYHVIESTAVDRALGFLMEHLPPRMQLLVATREDPQLPLPRLRARGQLTELRVRDLRFTQSEAAWFLNEVMGLRLSEKDITALETRTEGWIAGLQLAALSMRGREDVSEFIQAFAGDHRFILDYLAEEVLQRQPKELRSFLLQTSILERLSGPLCDAVTGQEDSNATLEALERGNLFVVALDDRRQWYRYHHLFADVLRASLMEEQPHQLPVLHWRASEWYEQNGAQADAVRHALAGEHYERAAQLIEQAWAAMDRRRQSATWLRWAQKLPEELVQARPVLSTGYAWAHLDAGELEAAEARLRSAERWLEPDSEMNRPVGEMAVTDEEEFQALPATIATARAYLAQAVGDVPGSMAHARRALQLLPESDHLRRGIAGALLGLSLWTRGELEAAYDSFARAMAHFEMAGNILFAITGTYVLADIRLAQGRLRDAIRIYEQSLQLVTGQGGSALRGMAELHLGLSLLYREQGNVEAATRHLVSSVELGERVALPRWNYHWSLAQARMLEAEGDLDGALERLGEAQRAYIRGPVPDVRPIAALKARVWAAQGRIDEAMAWAQKEKLTVGDELSYVREFEHLTLARVLLAQYRRGEVEAIEGAARLLKRLLPAAENGGRLGSMLEILVLLALVHEEQGDMPAALAALVRALTLGEPQGYFRIFVDEGPPLARLLSEAAARGLTTAYGRRLLAAIEALKEGGAGDPALLTPAPSQPLVEPLSERELEVLQLVSKGLSNREISERLFVALSTVKGHNRNIFAKLQVRRRTEAVARAHELGLL